ncbi:MAG TPA: PQQ-binding-like beta-propeller repeat protein, partial [Planctomycetota bacterium]|nr:PQQ-binding-like beta-propeller repeat protein [Planctomycetota bacterium]
ILGTPLPPLVPPKRDSGGERNEHRSDREHPLERNELSESKGDKMPYEMKVKWKVEYDTSGQGFQEERTINTITLSADGKRLYAPLISSYERREQQLGFLVVKYPFPMRSLFCFDTTTAKALWTTEKAPDPKDTNNAFEDIIFPVAPAEEDGVLYVAGLLMPHQVDIPEHYLFAINARNGAVYFKTFIGSGILETNLFNNPSREPIASAVTVDSDNIYYCSQMGIITAVDKYTGIIKWLKKYDEYFIPTTWPNYTPPHLPLRWINNPIVRIDNTSFAEAKGQPARLDDASRSGGILVTAIDSPFLYLLSANTGEELWRWNGDNAPLGNIRQLVGVKDGFLVVSGESGIICLNLNKGGEEKWKRDGNRIIGKSAITDDRIYIPENYTITEIELKTGKLISKDTFHGKEDNQPSANLLIAGDFLIRNSIGQMNTYRIEDKKESINSPR